MEMKPNKVKHEKTDFCWKHGSLTEQMKEPIKTELIRTNINSNHVCPV